MTRPTFIFVVLLSVQTVQAFPITGNHRTHREQLVVRVERLFQSLLCCVAVLGKALKHQAVTEKSFVVLPAASGRRSNACFPLIYLYHCVLHDQSLAFVSCNKKNPLTSLFPQLQDRVYRRRSEKHVREEEGSRRHHVQKREGSDPSHFSECPAHYEGYCLNGGRCRYAAEMGTASCFCPLTQFGQRCQNSQPIEEDVFGDLRRLFGSWSHSEPFYRRKKWRRP
ncbi:uncharacterized protein [Branchiostoma lanceolatum]|uniref:uncharacterized protein n=1 Tax=Branchiostoma lanceolatum TaxID=7740 RepID=UPI00345233FA